MINSQQLLVILPLMKVILPVSASQFFQQINAVAAFEFYDIGDILLETLQLEPTDPLSDGFEKLGFESRYFLNNMGTMILFYVSYPLAVFIWRLLYYFRHCSYRMHKFMVKYKKILFYEWIIVAIFESYSVVAICCLIAYPHISFETWGMTVQSFSCIFFTVSFVIFPFSLIRFLTRQM